MKCVQLLGALFSFLAPLSSASRSVSSKGGDDNNEVMSDILLSLNEFNLFVVDEDPETRFMTWLKEAGVKAKGIRMTKNISGKTYVANKDILKDEPVLSIPRELIISVHSAKSGRTAIMREVNKDLPEYVVLALHILEERMLEQASKWYPFIDHLLAKTLKSSIFFSEDDLSYLKGSQLYHTTNTRIDAMRNMFNALVEPITSDAVKPPLFTHGQFTEKNFKWALASVWAHSIEIQNFHTGQVEIMLIPIIDSLHHDTHANTKIRMDSEGKNVILFAQKDIPSGSQLYINTGTIDMNTFMATRGYVPDDSEVQVLPINIGLNEDDALYDVKALIHEKLNTTMQSSYFLKLGQPVSDEIIRSMRIKLLQGAEVERLKYALSNQVVSIRNEYAVHRSILQTCATTLTQYPTSIEDDKIRLEEKDLTESVRDSIRAIINDKRILKETEIWVRNQWTALLDDNLPYE